MAIEGSITDVLVEEVRYIDAQLLDVVSDVPQEMFVRSVGGTAPSIGFHLWHVARWADLFQSAFPGFAGDLARLGPNEQIWEREGLAAHWGMQGGLGKRESGQGLDEEASTTLPLPEKEVVLGYATPAFEAVERVLGGLRDDELLAPTRNFYDDEPWTVLDHFGWYSGHSARHLGMIEALKGVLGMRGTVTV